MIKFSYYYDTINKRGELEPWSGSFRTDEARLKWYDKFGKQAEANGHILVLRKVKYRKNKSKWIKKKPK